MKKPIILVIENSIDVTGALKSITRTAYDLRDFFDFQFVVPARTKGKFWIENKGFTTFYELPMREMSRRLVSLFMYIPSLTINAIRLHRLIQKNNIALVHSNDLYNLLPVVVRIFGSTTPYVCHIRFLPDKFPPLLFQFWLRLHLRFAEKIVAVSASLASQLPGHAKITVIHNELPVEERYAYVIQPDTTRNTNHFLYLSNYIEGKGQIFALQAFASIHEQLPGWKLKFVGGDMGLQKNNKYKSKLQALAEEYGIEKKTEWGGFTEEVEREYKQSDIVLNFSESESFSITCVEAQFFGRPVIATRCGGPEEIIDEGKTGMLVPNRDVKSMAHAMLYLAQNSEVRVQMGRMARDSVRVKFSVENTSLKLMRIYKEILKV